MNPHVPRLAMEIPAGVSRGRSSPGEEEKEEEPQPGDVEAVSEAFFRDSKAEKAANKEVAGEVKEMEQEVEVGQARRSARESRKRRGGTSSFTNRIFFQSWCCAK
jgi:hypothetical protein